MITAAMPSHLPSRKVEAKLAAMESNLTPFPEWPTGLWRRVIIQPGAGWIGGALEDDVHCFHMRFDHENGRIVRARAAALRHPWTACPGAAPHIAGELTGALLSEVAARDPSQHCTHLFDLAVVLAAHADDTEPTTIDMRVADRIDERTTATMTENGAEVMRWRLVGTELHGEGRDLRQLSQWKRELSTRDAERATMLRRAVFVSGVRQYTAPAELTAAEPGSQRMGVCYNYQLPQAETSTRTPNWLTDWSAGAGEPLAGLDAEKVLAAL
jgi:hypothetical protein